MLRAYVQYSGPRFDECRRHLIIWPKSLWGRSAREFCCELSVPVSSGVNCKSCSNFMMSFDRPKPLSWSVRTVRWLSFEPNFESIVRMAISGGSLLAELYVHIYRVLRSTINR